MHLWAKKRKPSQQLTLDQLAMGEIVDVTGKLVGLCSPGRALISHFFLSEYDATADFKFSWRQQNVPARIIAVDATYKRDKKLSLPIRQTVWENNIGCPLIAINTSSASMDDPAFVAACRVYVAVRALLDMAAVVLCYLDMPLRDGPGMVQRFPKLVCKSTRLGHICLEQDGGIIGPTSNVSDVDFAVQLFSGAPELGFDQCIPYSAYA